MIARPATLPNAAALPAAGAVFRHTIALQLPVLGADALRIVAASCELQGRFNLLDFAAPAAAISAPASGVFTVTLDAPRQVHRVLLNGRPNHKVALLRLDGNRQAPPTATLTQGSAYAAPPADFTDRRFALRIEDSSGAVETGAPAGALNQLQLRSRPARPRLALAAPGQEAAATVFWTAPPAAALPDEAAIPTSAAAAFAAALQAYVDRLDGPLGTAVSVSLVAESDAPCRLTLTSVAAAYRLVRAAFAGAHAGAAKAVLKFGAGAVGAEEVAVALPAGAVVARAEVATSETLPAARPASGDWTERAGSLACLTGLHVAPGRGAAARLTTSAGLRAARVALGVLVLATPAELQVQLVADRDGQPAGPALGEGSNAAASAAPGQRLWVTVGVGDVPLPPGGAVWVVLSAVRGAVVWLTPPASAARPETPLRGGDGSPLDGLAALADLLGAPVPATASEAPAEPLALALDGVPVQAPAAVDGRRAFDIAPALAQRLAGPAGALVTVPLTFRALGPGAVTVYPPVVEYDL